MLFITIAALLPAVSYSFSNSARPRAPIVTLTLLQVTSNQPNNHIHQKGPADRILDFLYITAAPLMERLPHKSSREEYSPIAFKHPSDHDHSEGFWYNAALYVRSLVALPIYTMTADFGDVQDVIDEWEQKIEVDPHKHFEASTHTLDKEGVLGPFHDLGNVQEAEKFVADGVASAVDRFDRPMDPSRVVKQPNRFVKPLPLSQLRKAMKHDPNYFNH